MYSGTNQEKNMKYETILRTDVWRSYRALPLMGRIFCSLARHNPDYSMFIAGIIAGIITDVVAGIITYVIACVIVEIVIRAITVIIVGNVTVIVAHVAADIVVTVGAEAGNVKTVKYSTQRRA